MDARRRPATLGSSAMIVIARKLCVVFSMLEHVLTARCWAPIVRAWLRGVRARALGLGRAASAIAEAQGVAEGATRKTHGDDSNAKPRGSSFSSTDRTSEVPLVLRNSSPPLAPPVGQFVMARIVMHRKHGHELPDDRLIDFPITTLAETVAQNFCARAAGMACPISDAAIHGAAARLACHPRTARMNAHSRRSSHSIGRPLRPPQVLG